MLNEEAAEHAREMRRYRESYRKTEAEVKEKTKRQTARFTKIILSLVLILLSVAAVWFGRNAYSFRYNQKRADAVRIAKEVLNSRRYNESLKKLVKGLMIESYLVDGNQKVGGDVFGQSITDPCLGWEKTERLVLDIADAL